MIWIGLVPAAENYLGMIPEMVSADDPRPVAEQFNENYAHGGGWGPMVGWKLDLDDLIISYDDDTPLSPVAVAKCRDETIVVYRDAWAAIIDKDGNFQVSRMD